MATKLDITWQDQIILLLHQGHTLARAARWVGISQYMLRKTILNDEEFKARVDAEKDYSASMVFRC